MPVPEYQVVPKERAAQIRNSRHGTLASPILIAIIEGEVIHVPTTGNDEADKIQRARVAAKAYQALPRRGLKARTRADEHGGFYIWATEPDEDPLAAAAATVVDVPDEVPLRDDAEDLVGETSIPRSPYTSGSR